MSTSSNGEAPNNRLAFSAKLARLRGTKDYHRNNTYAFRVNFWLGIGCVLLGMSLNPWTLGHLLTPDGTINSTIGRSLIFALETIFVGFGLYLVIKRPTVSFANALLVLASSFIALLVGAGLVQILYSPPAVISGWRARVTVYEQNQLGYRGHPIAYSNEDYVIVLVGDSHVEARACAYDYLPETRLEYHLNKKGKKVKVFSVGSGGYGQDQQLLALRDYYSKYRADLVLLWQSPANDVWNNIFPTHWPTNANPKPTFWLENGLLKGPTEEIGETLAYPTFKLLSLFPNFIPSISQRDTMWEEKLPAAYRPLSEYQGPVNYELQKRWDRTRHENLGIEKSHFAIRLTPRSDRMKYGLELTRRLLQEIERLALANNGRLIVFTVSTPGEKIGSNEEVYVLNGKYYRTSEAQFSKNMADLQAGLEALDVHVSLEKWRVGPEDSHLNEHATDEAMMNLSKLLEKTIPNP
jgi:hypothetical protein